jgi:hypothetical protein
MVAADTIAGDESAREVINIPLPIRYIRGPFAALAEDNHDNRRAHAKNEKRNYCRGRVVDAAPIGLFSFF